MPRTATGVPASEHQSKGQRTQSHYYEFDQFSDLATSIEGVYHADGELRYGVDRNQWIGERAH